MWDGKLRQETSDDVPNSNNILKPPAIKEDFQVNENDWISISNQDEAAIAMYSDSSFVVAWTDYRNLNADIYAQRFNANGTPIGTNFRVNDDTGTEDQMSPCIAVNGSGDFIIAWEDDRNGDPDIYAQRYSKNGQPIGNNFKVNDDVGGSS